MRPTELALEDHVRRHCHRSSNHYTSRSFAFISSRTTTTFSPSNKDLDAVRYRGRLAASQYVQLSVRILFFPPAVLGEKLTVHGEPDVWRRAFDRTGLTWLLHITGGEPTIYPRFA